MIHVPWFHRLPIGGEPLGLFEDSGISPESSVPLDVGVAEASGAGETVVDAPWMDSSDGSAVPGEVVDGISKVVVRRLECRLVERVWSEVRDRNQHEIMDKLHTVPMDESSGRVVGQTIEWLTEERSGLEKDLNVLAEREKRETLRLCGVQVGGDQVHLGKDSEVLQTTTVSLDEVRKNLQEWIPAMKNEYHSLTEETQAIIPVEEGQLDMSQAELVPGKLVCTVKAGPNGGRKKVRGVVCGNLLNEANDPAPAGVYASGADGTLTRAAIRYGVLQGWGMDVTDIKTAFLLAPRPPPEAGTREAIVIPPKVLVAAGVVSPTERWRVSKALYGFNSSPNHWAGHRDRTVRTFRWTDTATGKRLGLVQTAEGNLWRIGWESEDGSIEGCCGHLVVYVDDLMVLGPSHIRQGFLTRLQQEWKVSTPETVGKDQWTRFCGFELKWDDDTHLRVAQPSYIEELLERHRVQRSRNTPVAKSDPPEEPEVATAEDVRAAQALTGELLWLSIRSRPDISYGVGMMGRNALKNPRWSMNLGVQLLEFLKGTPTVGLVYGPCDSSHGEADQLSIPRHDRLLEAFSDVSFAPGGERSIQGIVTCLAGGPIQWESSRQAFSVLSTAEAELMGYVESLTMLMSVEALMVAITGEPNGEGFEKVILGDNLSAIQIVQKPDGPWRTRHLRLRANCLKEKLQLGNQWRICHVRGSDLIADFLTKAITQPSAWVRFWSFLGMSFPSTEDCPTKVAAAAKVAAISGVAGAACFLARAAQLREAMLELEPLTASLGALLVGIAALLLVVKCSRCRDLNDVPSLRSFPRVGRDLDDVPSLRSFPRVGRDLDDVPSLRSFPRVGRDLDDVPFLRSFPRVGHDVNYNDSTASITGFVDDVENVRSSVYRADVVVDPVPSVKLVGPVQARGWSQVDKNKEDPTRAKGHKNEKRKTEWAVGKSRTRENEPVLVGELQEAGVSGEGRVRSEGSADGSAVARMTVCRESPELEMPKLLDLSLQGSPVSRPRLKAMASPAAQVETFPMGAELLALDLFQEPPQGSSDYWKNLQLGGRSFWIKYHRKLRWQSLHPLHRKSPKSGLELQPERMQIRYPVGYPVRKLTVVDRWDGPVEKERLYQWRGYTIFVTSAGSQGSTPAMAEEGGLHPPGVPPETVDEFNQGVTESWLAPPMNLETDQHFEGSEAHWGPGFSQAPQGVPQGYSAPVAISAAAINAEDDATVEDRSHQQRSLEGLEAGKTVERAIAHGSIARRWRRAPVQGQQGTLSAPRANRATGSMGSTDGFDRGPEVHPQAQVDYEAALGRAAAEERDQEGIQQDLYQGGRRFVWLTAGAGQSEIGSAAVQPPLRRPTVAAPPPQQVPTPGLPEWDVVGEAMEDGDQVTEV